MKTFTLLTIDLSMFGEGAAAAAAPSGEGSAPAAAEAPAAAPEVRYGKQPEQTAAPQQTQNPAPEQPVDKGKAFKELISGEYKDQYAEATQKIINRRFRDTDATIKAQQPIIDTLAQRYGITNGDMNALLSAIENDTAYWQEAADQAGMTVDQYQRMRKMELQNQKLLDYQRSQQQEYLAQRRYQAWEAEAETLKQKYPDFDLRHASENSMFLYLLQSGNYPMEEAYEAAFAKQLAANAAANAEKAVTDNIRARGSRPAEAGSASTPAFTVKDDVSKLSNEDVLTILKKLGSGERISFG